MRILHLKTKDKNHYYSQDFVKLGFILFLNVRMTVETKHAGFLKDI
jgi:hypothetical protein